MLCKINHSIENGLKELFYLLLGRYSLYSAKSITIDKGHKNSMTIAVNRSWYWQFILVKQLHEQKLTN